MGGDGYITTIIVGYTIISMEVISVIWRRIEHEWVVVLCCVDGWWWSLRFGLKLAEDARVHSCLLEYGDCVAQTIQGGWF